MNESTLSDKLYGTFAPSSPTRIFQAITKWGLAHGKIAKLLRKGWLKKHGPVVDVEVRGIKYRLNLLDNTTDNKILISSKTYDKPELDALSARCKGKVFVDIGANIGYYSLNLLHSGCARVVAIEPNPPSLARLNYNIAINQMQDRVEVVAAGVGPEGELTFYQTGGLGGSSFVKPEKDAPTITVRTRPLLSILKDGNVTEIGGMKIDVEGFEDQVLIPFLAEAPDALLPKCVVMESCHNNEWKTDLKAQFLAKGYRLKQQTRSNYIFERD